MKVRCVYAEVCRDEGCPHFLVHEWDRLRGCLNRICGRVRVDDADCEAVKEDHNENGD